MIHHYSDFQGNPFARRLLPQMLTENGLIERTTRQLKSEPRTALTPTERLIRYDRGYVYDLLLNALEPLNLTVPETKQLLANVLKLSKHGKDYPIQQSFPRLEAEVLLGSQGVEHSDN